MFISGERKTANNLDSLQCFVLAVDLGHNIPQQFGLLLTGRSEKHDRVESWKCSFTCCEPGLYLYSEEAS